MLVAQLCSTLCDPMDCTHQAPLSMEFSRQECWSGQPVPSPGDLPIPETEPESPALHADSLLSEPPGKPTHCSRCVLACAKLLQLCPTLCHPMDCSPPGCSVHGILQAGLPYPSPGDLPDPGIEPMSLLSPALAYHQHHLLLDAYNICLGH